MYEHVNRLCDVMSKDMRMDMSPDMRMGMPHTRRGQWSYASTNIHEYLEILTQMPINTIYRLGARYEDPPGHVFEKG